MLFGSSRYDLVFVEVVTVRCVPVTVVNVIDVVTVFDRFVATVFTVLVLSSGVLSNVVVFVVVVAVERVNVTVVQVVNVVAAINCFVPAVCTVLMLGDGVLGSLVFGQSFLLGAWSNGPLLLVRAFSAIDDQPVSWFLRPSLDVRDAPQSG